MTGSRLRRLASFAAKAVHRPPGFVARRVLLEARRQLRRPLARWRRPLGPERLLRETGAASIDALWQRVTREPFFLQPGDRVAMAAAFRAQHPDAVPAVIARAEAVLRHEFDLLGSGPCALGPSLPWHEDFKTGTAWPLEYAHDLHYDQLDAPSDVKVPWELSRFQHLAWLGQAWWLTGEERYAAEAAAQVSDWISRNPYERGVNWICTMDVALRAVSWIWGLHFFADAASFADPAVRAAWLASLYEHGVFIEQNLELSDVNGNHYLADGVGLVLVGVAFGSSRAGRRWLSRGLALVEGELPLQVSGDGVDFEQSIAYHRLVLEAFLTALLQARLAGRDAGGESWARVERMCEFVAAYTKPDGLAPLVGDADDGRVQWLGTQAIGDHRYLLSCGAVLFGGRALRHAAGRCWDETFWLLGAGAREVFERIEPLEPEPRLFAEGGFAVLRARDSHALVDCGEVGMRGRGGHGHNDVLGFELVLEGMPLVTDCGAYLYTASVEWRNRFRSTAFHNVVEVDGEELNRLVSPTALWSLRYDAKPTGVAWTADEEICGVAAGHTGYERLPDPVRCRRALVLDRRFPACAVRDSLRAAGTHSATWRFHLAPGTEAVLDGGRVTLARGDARAELIFPVLPPAASVRLDAGWASPSYGVRVPIAVVVVDASFAGAADLLAMFTRRTLPDDRRRLLIRRAEELG